MLLVAGAEIVVLVLSLLLVTGAEVIDGSVGIELAAGSGCCWDVGRRCWACCW